MKDIIVKKCKKHNTERGIAHILRDGKYYCTECHPIIPIYDDKINISDLLIAEMEGEIT